MQYFLQDGIVEPRESAHFDYYIPGSETLILPLKNSSLYREDWIGLRRLDVAGKLHLLEVDGGHVQFDYDWFLETIVRNYLS